MHINRSSLPPSGSGLGRTEAVACATRARGRMARPSSRFTARGFTYTEVLLSVALLMILLVPALEALQNAIAGTPTAAVSGEAGLHAKMEQVLAAPFSKLYAETYLAGGNTPTSVSATFSDPIETPERKIVVIYRYDALTRTLATADTGLVYVSVYAEAEGAAGALNTLAGRWW